MQKLSVLCERQSYWNSAVCYSEKLVRLNGVEGLLQVPWPAGIFPTVRQQEGDNTLQLLEPQRHDVASSARRKFSGQGIAQEQEHWMIGTVHKWYLLAARNTNGLCLGLELYGQKVPSFSTKRRRCWKRLGKKGLPELSQELTNPNMWT